MKRKNTIEQAHKEAAKDILFKCKSECVMGGKYFDETLLPQILADNFRPLSSETIAEKAAVKIMKRIPETVGWGAELKMIIFGVIETERLS